MEDKKQDDEKEKKVSEVSFKGFTEEKKPKIRFAGFTDDWKQCKFGDIGSVSMCKRIFKDETSEDGEIPFYKIGTFGGTPDAYISRELFEEYKSKFSYPEDGDILLSASGTIGRIVEYNGEEAYFQDSNIVWLKHNKSISNKFLKVLYPTVKWDGIEGSTIQRLYNDNFLKTRFMMPSLAEQERIGEYFENLDNLITLYQRKCNELKEVKKYMLQKMFPKNGETKPEIRFNGFTGDWEQKKLCEICNYISTNLTVKDIEKNGTVDLYDANGIIGKTTKNVQNRDYITIIKDGAGVGRVRLLSKNTSFISTMGAISTNNNSIEFLYYLISIIDFKKYIKTGTIPHIYFSEYGDEIIQLPSYEEQEKIGKFFYNLDNLISLYQRKCDELKKVKKYMLQNMFPRMS